MIYSHIVTLGLGWSPVACMEPQAWSSTPDKPRMGSHVCRHSTGEVETGGVRSSGCLQLHGKAEAVLWYTRSISKTKPKQYNQAFLWYPLWLIEHSLVHFLYCMMGLLKRKPDQELRMRISVSPSTWDETHLLIPHLLPGSLIPVSTWYWCSWVMGTMRDPTICR